MNATDRAGRTWTVTRTFAPWWRLVQPVNILKERLLIRRAEPPPEPTTDTDEDVPKVAYVLVALLAIVSFAQMLAVLLFFPLLGALMLVEMALQGFFGGILVVLRATGLARHRIEVVGWDGGAVRALSVLLVRGTRERADTMVRRIAANRAETERAFSPKKLPGGVTLRWHASFWR